MAVPKRKTSPSRSGMRRSAGNRESYAAAQPGPDLAQHETIGDCVFERKPPRDGLAALSGFVAVLSGLNFWGVLSPAAAGMLFAIYFFSLGENTALVYGLFALGAGGHLVIGILIMSGAIPELGVVRSGDIALRDQIISQSVGR